ncbi:galactose mutarotase [Vibrio hannami]|uniref:aldose epimerase family protein n=1 Tax=Vibrio hannami TaxID=2717094 RepID=UPI00240ED075|nr:aldose epimerase family protein [Vibrio hannami]MDG3087868.1 galactose mutarotase [Vibrio hannami]
MLIEKYSYGIFYNQDVNRFVLTNDNGMSVSVLELGGIVSHLFVPDNNGKIEDIVLGFDSIGDYAKDNHYFGAMIGRVANRIENASFKQDDLTIKVNGNAYDGRHCVHGGRFGYHKRVWKAVNTSKTDSEVSLTLKLLDADGEEGFQNNVEVLATYTLTNSNRLELSYKAVADGPTPISMTAHSYFNLFGHDTGSIKDHKLTIYADKYLEQKEDRIPSGNILDTADSGICFLRPTTLEEGVKSGAEINHSYVIPDNDGLKLMAKVEGGGRCLSVYSNESTLHFYNGHNLDGVKGKADTLYERYAGLCLEPKGFVNGVNTPNFPCTVIDKSKTYEHTIVYDFG